MGGGGGFLVPSLPISQASKCQSEFTSCTNQFRINNVSWWWNREYSIWRVTVVMCCHCLHLEMVTCGVMHISWMLHEQHNIPIWGSIHRRFIPLEPGTFHCYSQGHPPVLYIRLCSHLFISQEEPETYPYYNVEFLVCFLFFYGQEHKWI